ncbi:OmpA family protein [Aerolutibacter ruishenii]|uniref:Outer membrane protein OmpA-like peptidoglycan-associated protein n=1 Tax=Aerolutibacter ruishenii TaxID=686800 RepID=A0A562M2W4_9GAMM|nr:OmpA family protein [Lysobacter ruishenii]TWI14285.1 outer membrane protein OmpA-like peptidoglycan-associated protein [Lysobacter ruishenii]
MTRPVLIAMALGLTLAAGQAFAQDKADAMARLNARLVAVEADARFAGLAAYERLQAHQALDALAKAPGREREAALFVAERRVETAEIAARTQLMQREIDRLDRERGELMLEASRQDAARARAEAERLRMEAQLQAEEAARLRAQAEADALVRQDVETALEGVAGAQEAKLNAARARELQLARQEAELVAGAKLPPSRVDARGEVFTLAGESFASGKASLTPGATKTVKALSAYLQAVAGTRARVEGHTDSQGSAAANRSLSQQRADAVRASLVAGGVAAGRVQAVGHGADQPVGDNRTAAGRAANRRVDVVVSSK